jgi:hypothetical protein
MAYDEELVHRIRVVLSVEPGLTEKRMFGGLAFLIGGNMAVAASGEGGLLLRIDPVDSDEFCRTDGVDRAVMRGREMRGWLRVLDAAIEDDSQLERWVAVGRDYARSLPAK